MFFELWNSLVVSFVGCFWIVCCNCGLEEMFELGVDLSQCDVCICGVGLNDVVCEILF